MVYLRLHLDLTRRFYHFATETEFEFVYENRHRCFSLAVKHSPLNTFSLHDKLKFMDFEDIPGDVLPQMQ